MSPTAVLDANPEVHIADLKAKIVEGHVELEVKPPLADNYMYDFKYNHQLPTLEFLGRDVPADVDAQHEAQLLIDELSRTLGAGDAQGFADLFVDYGQFPLILSPEID